MSERIVEGDTHVGVVVIRQRAGIHNGNIFIDADLALGDGLTACHLDLLGNIAIDKEVVISSGSVGTHQCGVDLSLGIADGASILQGRTARIGTHVAEITRANFSRCVVVAKQQHRQVTVDFLQSRTRPFGIRVTTAVCGGHPSVHGDKHRGVAFNLIVGIHVTKLVRIYDSSEVLAVVSYVSMIETLTRHDIDIVDVAVGTHLLDDAIEVRIHSWLVIMHVDIAVLNGSVRIAAQQAAQLYVFDRRHAEFGIDEGVVDMASFNATYQTACNTSSRRVHNDYRHSHRRVDLAIQHLAHQSTNDNVLGFRQIDFQGGFTARDKGILSLKIADQSANVVGTGRTDLRSATRLNQATYHKGTFDLTTVDIAKQTIVGTFVAMVAQTNVFDEEAIDNMSLTIESATEFLVIRTANLAIATNRHPNILFQVEVVSQ